MVGSKSFLATFLMLCMSLAPSLQVVESNASNLAEESVAMAEAIVSHSTTLRHVERLPTIKSHTIADRQLSYSFKPTITVRKYLFPATGLFIVFRSILI